LVAILSARSGDVAWAEDSLADAFEAALRTWPQNGIPNQPDAWLLTVARRAMIDAARSRKRHMAVVSDLELIADEAFDPDNQPAIPDQRLALMFACAHPAIDRHIRAPLILQTVLGFDAAAIASAFLIAPSTMSQRLVRAKTKIKEARIPFHIPEPSELGERVGAVLDAIYATYTDGWSDPNGTEPHRLNSAEEAIWLGRLAASLMPQEAEALGLLALMLYSESRRDARRDADGNYVPLSEQNPAQWDGRLVDEAEALLLQASRTGAICRYQLEAAIQSAHLIRRRNGSADWPAIVQLYDALYAVTMSPVVAINRAVAVSKTNGPLAGLTQLDVVANDARLNQYQPYWAARADLLAQTGNRDEAASAYDRAIGLEPDPAVRRFLLARRADAITR
jgi:RNA polymerase sigma-70 factor (ECF subfamily)